VRLVVAVTLLVACQREPATKAPPRKLEVSPAPAGEVAGIVVPELARANTDGKYFLIYVGAVWCEPCREFHEAARAGSLDATLGDMRMIEFDLDRDQARLEAAGYRSPLVPMFAIPGADGRASGKQTGGVRTDGGDHVEQLTKNLRALVDKP
jgi:thiol-disulfide isomerase/thioredoxin